MERHTVRPLGAYGTVRVQARDGLPLFPLRIAGPADVPALVVRACEATEAAAIRAAEESARADELAGPDDWGAAWAVVPVEDLDLDAFDAQGVAVAPYLDRVRLTFGRVQDEGGRS